MTSLVEGNLWDKVLRAIKTKLQLESFETWFDPIHFEGIDNARRLIRLRAPNQVVRDWVKVNYANLIDQSLGELCLSSYSVDWILPEEKFNPTVTLPNAKATSNPSLDNQAPLRDTVPTLSPGAVKALTQSQKEAAFDPALNSKYTF